MSGGPEGRVMKRLAAIMGSGCWLVMMASPAVAAEAEGGAGLWYRGLIALAAGLGLACPSSVDLQAFVQARRDT